MISTCGSYLSLGFLIALSLDSGSFFFVCLVIFHWKLDIMRRLVETKWVLHMPEDGPTSSSRPLVCVCVWWEVGVWVNIVRSWAEFGWHCYSHPWETTGFKCSSITLCSVQGLGYQSVFINVPVPLSACGFPCECAPQRCSLSMFLPLHSLLVTCDSMIAGLERRW